MYQAEMLGQSVDNGKVQQLSLDYAKLNQNKKVAELSSAEGVFVKMSMEIQAMIQQGIESEFVK